MRLDKFLKDNHIIKRRVMAQDAIKKGFILKNGNKTKPGVEIKDDDIIQINFSNRTLKIKVVNDKAEFIEEVIK
jgi:ribosomal 50S subunit-recycling heat shock protein